MCFRHRPILLFIFFSIALPSCVKKSSTNDPTAEGALSTFTIEPGFKIELIASEPQVADPVDMEIDEFGRLYVVEMPGYPLDVSGSGRIKLLSDADGDGMMDSSIVFADNLILPNSLMRWKNGLLVTDAPNVLYLEDSDNDGRADVRDTLLTGFALSNPQHNLNSPLLAIDNWIYLAHEGTVSTETYENEFGDAGRQICYPRHPESPRLPVNANGRSVRFRPDRLQLEELSSHTQFGQTFDQWGNHLLVGNANHIYHEVLAQRYLERNSSFLLSDPSQSISDHGNAAEVFPTTINPQHQLLTDVGVITSACGLTAYLGGDFPEPYNENTTFVAEPVSNLIHVDKIAPKGSTFSASRIKENEEFLTSSDHKFRPVNLYVGPDGALYVVDYYRQIIEHPEWMGNEVIESGQLYNDTDKGRIYRISKNNADKPQWTKGLNLGSATIEELVAKLEDKNIWWRQNAQRLLVDRRASESIELLKKTVTSGNPTGRLHALWTLQGIDQLTPDLIKIVLHDVEAGIRKNAIKLAELHLQNSPMLVQELLGLQSDPDPAVRFQLLCTLGFIESDEAARAREALLFKDISDMWVQEAAMSASADPQNLTEIVIGRLNDGSDTERLVPLLEKLVAMLAASNRPGTSDLLLNYVQQAEDGNQFAVEAGVFHGIAQALQHNSGGLSFTSFQRNGILQKFFQTRSAEVRRSALGVARAAKIKNVPAQLIKNALTIARDTTQPEAMRVDAIDFLALQEPSVHADALRKFLVPQESLPIQLAALRTLSEIPNTSLAEYLVTSWQALTPELQDAAIRTFLTNDARIEILLTAIEGRKIPASSISWPRRVRLMSQHNDMLRDRSRAIFASGEKQDVSKKYQAALSERGSAEKGKIVFQKNCSLCHQVRGAGGLTIGPDLGTIHNWSAEAIMTHTLNPNLSISSGFDLWSVQLNNGETIQGIIASESPTAVTLSNVGAQDVTIHRNEIKSIKALNMSIMPENLEKQISIQDMTDLLAFLRGR